MRKGKAGQTTATQARKHEQKAQGRRASSSHRLRRIRGHLEGHHIKMNCASDRNGSSNTISSSEKSLRSERKNHVEGRFKEGVGLLNREDLKDTEGGRSREHCWEGVSRDRRLEGERSQRQRWLGAEGKGEVSCPERSEGAVPTKLAQPGPHPAPTAVSQTG